MPFWEHKGWPGKRRGLCHCQKEHRWTWLHGVWYCALFRFSHYQIVIQVHSKSQWAERNTHAKLKCVTTREAVTCPSAEQNTHPLLQTSECTAGNVVVVDAFKARPRALSPKSKELVGWHDKYLMCETQPRRDFQSREIQQLSWRLCCLAL